MGVSLPVMGVPLWGGVAFETYLRSVINTYGGDMLSFQELSGSYPQAYNTALAEGRQIALLTYADYVAGAGWSNPSAQLATHAAASGTATLAQAGLLQPGRTYKLVTVVSGRTAGTVTPTGGAAIAVDGTNTQTITATGTALTYTPTTDFDGTINCATVALTQTNILASSAYPGAELLVDGNMEAADTSAWSTSTGTLSKQTTNPHGGSRLLRIAYLSTANPTAYQGIMTVGKRYKFPGWARGDGTGYPRFILGNLDVSGTISTDWQYLEIEGMAASAIAYVRLMGSSGYVEFDDLSVTEVNPLNTTNTGADVGQAATGPLRYAYYFDGTNDYVTWYSQTLNSFVNPSAGTLLAFAKVSGAGVWTDGTVRFLGRLYADANNYIGIYKPTANNQLIFQSVFGGVDKSVTISSLSYSGWFMVALTWDKTADESKMFINGVQVGATQTGLGTWVGNLDSTRAIIGAGVTTPLNVWSGWECYPTLSRTVVPQPILFSIAQRAGVA